MVRPPQSRRAFAGTILPLLCLVAPLVATPAPSSAQDTAEATELLEHATTTIAGVASFHFKLTTPRGQTRFMENFELTGIEGDVQRPDRFRATITAKAAIIELTVKVVGVGTQLWVTDPMSQEERYVEIDLHQGQGASAAALLNPDRVLLAALHFIENPTVAGEDEIDGVETTRIAGTFDLARVAPSGTPVPGLQLQDPLLVSFWIDDAGHLRRLELDGPLTTDEPPDVRRRLDLSAFDEPVDIQPPVGSRQ